jgi:hypothetical protein
MRSLVPFLIAALVLASTGAHARPAAPRASAPDAASAASASPRLIEQGHYRNVDGAVVHSPAHAEGSGVPAGASARCHDGSWSFSLHRRGTCSHHGGVARWM